LAPPFPNPLPPLPRPDILVFFFSACCAKVKTQNDTEETLFGGFIKLADRNAI
jgi:hypothetical protein